jgi:hypothetical protein
MPYVDEWLNLPIVVGERPLSAASLWEPIGGDHRLPLARLVHVAVLRATGLEMRAGMTLNVLLLAGASLALMRANEASRSHPSLADAFFPLALLSVGQWMNVFVAINVLFVAPVSLCLAGMASGVRRGEPGSVLIGAVGVGGIVAPFFDQCGVALSLPLIALLLCTGWRLRQSRPSHGAWALSLALAGLAASAAVVAASSRIPASQPLSVAEAPRAILEVFATAFGPAAFGWPVLSGSAALGVTVLGLVIACRGLREASFRLAALTLAAGAVATLLLAAAVGLARGNHGPGMALQTQYTTLMLPGLCAAHLALTQFGGRLLSVLGPCLLSAAAAVLFPLNAFGGLEVAKARHADDRAFAADLLAGRPLEELVAHHSPALMDHDVRDLPADLRLAERHRLGPFHELGRPMRADGRDFRAETVEVRPIYDHAVKWEGSRGRSTGWDPYFVLALPGTRLLRGVRMTIARTVPADRPDYLQVWWLDGADAPLSERRANAHFWLEASPEPYDLTTWIYARADRIRIDPCTRDCSFEVRALTLLGDVDGRP